MNERRLEVYDRRLRRIWTSNDRNEAELLRALNRRHKQTLGYRKLGSEAPRASPFLFRFSTAQLQNKQTLSLYI